MEKPKLDRVEFGTDKRALRIYNKVYKSSNKYSPAISNDKKVN